jgi:L-threonylcarbamoyladenylate synthase
VALFPADTVYGLACDPESEAAVARLYEIKGRPADRPAAVMFFSLDLALGALPDLGSRTRAALERLLPGPVTLLLPNPKRRFQLACGPAPERLGLRVPDVPLFADVGVPVMQSSANPSGGADARRLSDVDPRIRAAVDLELDGGELPGTPSTVIDLSEYEAAGEYAIVREGALSAAAVGVALG